MLMNYKYGLAKQAWWYMTLVVASKALPAADWDRLRTAAYQRAKYRRAVSLAAAFIR